MKTKLLIVLWCVLLSAGVVAVFSGCKKTEPDIIPVKKVESISLSPESLFLNIGSSTTLTAEILPSTASDKSLSWSSSAEDVATVDQNGKVTAVSKGTATITATAKDGSGVNSSCEIVVDKIDIPDAVDLGLSVYWGSFNMGASKPEEPGDYYAWGETETYYEEGSAQSEKAVWKEGKDIDGYWWYSYKWCTCEETYHTLTSITKYNTDKHYGKVDNKTVLEAGDDVASAMLGNSWRMPTEAEWDELKNTDNCSWEWTTLNEVHGYKVTSKKEGYTDKSIFLPAAGYRDRTTFSYLDEKGYYWSSSLNPNYPKEAYCLNFYSTYDLRKSGIDRSYGHSVRPVASK